MRQYYVGADGGYVAVFRGVSGGLGPFALSQVESVSDVTVDSLPDFEAMQVESTIATDSLAEAQQVVQRLSERADQCVAVPTTPGCPSAGADLTLPSVTPSATPSPSATVTG
jgi:protein phosphatase